MKRLIFIVALIILPAVSYAQFYVTGDDPGRLKWYTIDTENYRIIYPEGNDSLARAYGGNLEKYRVAVSRTSGYPAGEPGRKRMPVVLHTWNSSNGSVAWAPKRMDLFTIPSAYSPEPLSWDEMLAVHESRHITQMKFGMTKVLKPGNWFFGEMFNILASIVYPNMAFMEGDAVVAETAYTTSGRGRTADFLNYYRVAFDNGIDRSWTQWREDSQKHYGPDHYALGYLTLAGFRHFYDCPDYMSQAYHIAARQPYRLGIFKGLSKEISGERSFEKAFQAVADTMNVIWRAEAEERGPFIPMEQVTQDPRLYTDYVMGFFAGDEFYALKKGFMDTPSIVRLEDGSEEKITSFSARSGKIKVHLDKIYWSETRPDERWTMKTDSGIRFMDADQEWNWSGKKSLTRKDGLLYNPSPSQNGGLLACVEYLVKGGSALNVLSADDGKTIMRIEAPEGVQLVETAWIGNRIYVSGLSDNGYGIYAADMAYGDNAGKEEWDTVLEPQPVMMKDFGSYGDDIVFTSDRTGSNELYHFDPSDGSLVQKTSLRYGGEGFAYSPDGKWLYYSSQTVDGKMVFRTRTDDLMDIKADMADRHSYFLADAVTAQEREIALKDGGMLHEEEYDGFSDPRKYRKFPHMFNVHSWAPVYVNVDNIMNMSFDRIYQAASLGATGIFQNRLSTATGEFGYSAHKDPYNPAKWRHSGHARLTYSGLYPIFEVSVDFNDRAARQYNVETVLTDDNGYISINSKELPVPSFQGNIKTYIPFRFSSGGWTSGIIPQASYTITNDFFNNSMVVLSDRKMDGAFPGSLAFIGAIPGKNEISHQIMGSLRAYTMMGTAHSAVYPRWGIGFETGVMSMLTANNYYSPMGYAYVYGYVPGITRTQGLRLSATCQLKMNESVPFGHNIVNVLPRGFARFNSLSQSLTFTQKAITRLSADYAIPVFIGDIDIFGSIFYIKRLVLTPHFDFTFIGNTDSLWSGGCDLALDMASLLGFGWPCTIGVTASYNGGASYQKYQNEFALGRWHIGPVFNVTF